MFLCGETLLSDSKYSISSLLKLLDLKCLIRAPTAESVSTGEKDRDSWRWGEGGRNNSLTLIKLFRTLCLFPLVTQVNAFIVSGTALSRTSLRHALSRQLLIYSTRIT